MSWSISIIHLKPKLAKKTIKVYDHQLKKLFIVKQTLFVNTLGIVLENSMENMHTDFRV